MQQLLPPSEAIPLVLDALNASDKFPYWKQEPSPALEAYYARLFGEELMQKEKEKNYSPKQYESSLSWEHLLHGLLNAIPFDEAYFAGLINRINPDYSRRRTILLLIDKLLQHNQLDRTAQYIALIPDSNTIAGIEVMKYEGHRAVARWHAQQGDAARFLETLKHCEAKKAKHEIAAMKSTLAQRYFGLHGFEEALRLVNRKEFGLKYWYDCFTGLLETQTYAALKKIVIEKIPDNLNEGYARERLLVKSFAKNSETAFSTEEFDYLFNLIMLMPDDEKWGDFTLRDGLLLDLGGAASDAALVTKCRTAIKSKRLKTELGYHLERVKKKK